MCEQIFAQCCPLLNSVQSRRRRLHRQCCSNVLVCSTLQTELRCFMQPLPMRPPLMLVESGALNEAEDREGGHRHDGPVFHTRGLTLSEEHRSIRTVVGSRQERGGLMSIVPQMVPVVTSSHCEVSELCALMAATSHRRSKGASYGVGWSADGLISSARAQREPKYVVVWTMQHTRSTAIVESKLRKSGTDLADSSPALSNRELSNCQYE